MKRVNIQAAFIGEPTGSHEALDTIDGDEAVSLLVRGGEVTLVVPSATPDGRVIDGATHLRATLHLENERVLTIDVHGDAEGAYWEHEPAALHERRQEQAAGDMFRAGAPLFAQPAAATAPVRSIMTAQVVTVGRTATARELAELLTFHRISGVPVVDADGRLVGVVTESDLIARGGTTVAELMSEGVVSVGPDATIGQAAALIAERRVNRLPVVEDGRVVGLVSRADVVRWLARST